MEAAVASAGGGGTRERSPPRNFPGKKEKGTNRGKLGKLREN